MSRAEWVAVDTMRLSASQCTKFFSQDYGHRVPSFLSNQSRDQKPISHRPHSQYHLPFEFQFATSNMTISIIICTRNRADSLQETLVSIGKTNVREGWRVELIVVDNNSSDHTAAVVNNMRLTNVHLRYVNAPIAGQCQARNAGLREAKGEIILFTDDDIRVPRNWIPAMCEPITNQEADAVTGGVDFPPNVPALSQRPFSSLRSWFACTEDLDPRRPARMVGANMAFHRRILDRIPGFDVELGPGALGFGDDSLFSRQIQAAGYKLVGALDVVVEHHFDLSRLTKNRLITLARNMGRTRAFLSHHWEHEVVRRSRRKFIRTKLQQLWARRFALVGERTDTNEFVHALKMEQDHAYYAEYFVQRKRPFKYGLRGLKPIASEFGS